MNTPIETDDQIEQVRSALQSGVAQTGDTPLDEDPSPQGVDKKGHPVEPWTDAANAGESKPEPVKEPWDEPGATPVEVVRNPSSEQKEPWDDVPAEPDLKGVKEYFDSRYAGFRPPMKLPEQASSLTSLPGLPPQAPVDKPQVVDGQIIPPKAPEALSLADAFKYGMGMSATALSGFNPNSGKQMPSDPSLAQSVAAGAGQMVGDIPEMGAGAAIGAGIGAMTGPFAPAMVPLLGTAGACALPAAIRRVYLDNYKNGSVQNFSDLWPRIANVMYDSVHAAATCMAFEGAAGAVEATVAPSLLQTAAKYTAGVAAVTAAGPIFEQRTPSWNDLGTNAALILPLALLHMGRPEVPESPGVPENTPAIPSAESPLARMRNKLGEIWVKTGLTPDQVHQHAKENPTILQDLASEDKVIPEAYKPLIDPDMKDAKPTISNDDNKMAESFPQMNSKEFPQADYPNEVVPKDPEAKSIPDLTKLIGERLKTEKKGITGDQLKELIFDKLDPLNPDNAALPTKQNPHSLGLLAYGSSGEAYDAVYGAGIRSASDKSVIVHPPLKDVIENHKNDMRGFLNYIIAARSNELHENGITTLFDPEDAKRVVADGKDKYDADAKKLASWNNALLTEWQKVTGHISKDTVKATKAKHEYYYPTKYLTQNEEGVPFSSTRTVFKKIEGLKEESDANTIENPFLASANRANEMLKQMAIAKAKKAELALAPNDWVKEQMPGGMIPLNEQVLQELKDVHGLSPDVENILTPNNRKLTEKENQMTIWNDGKPQIYTVAEGKEGKVRAIRALDPNYIGPGGKVLKPVVDTLAPISDWFRKIETANPLFPYFHFARVELMSKLFGNEENRATFVDAISSMKELGKGESQLAQEYNASGARRTSYTDIEEQIKNDNFNLARETGSLDKARNVLRSPWDIHRAILAYSEWHDKAVSIADNATRFATFKAARESGKSIEEAGIAAVKVAPDSRQAGAALQFWNRVVPFQGLELNSVFRLGQKIAEDPADAALKTFVGLTLPSLGIWYANRDNKNFRNALWTDTSHIPIPLGDVIHKFPVPWLPGKIAMTYPMRMMDAAYQNVQDKSCFKDFDHLMDCAISTASMGTKGMGSDLLAAQPFGLPPYVKLLMEAMNNKNSYTGQPIVSDRYKYHGQFIDSNLQASEYTSAGAQAVSNLLHSTPLFDKNSTLDSPLMIDYLWHGITGQWGDLISTALGKVAQAVGLEKETPDTGWDIYDYPFMRSALYAHPEANQAAVREYYDHMNDLSRLKGDLEVYAKNGDTANVMKMQEKFRDIIDLDPELGRNAMRVWQNNIHKALTNPDFTPEDRRQTVNGLAKQMGDMAEVLNKKFRSVSDQYKPQEPTSPNLYNTGSMP